MRRTPAVFLAIASMALLPFTSVHASTYVGQILAIRTEASHTTANTIRIGVQVSGTTVCSNNVWYAAELPDASAVGKAWIATLLAAQARGASVSIGGTATCDPYGIEGILYLDALP
jgi:hypothetical protein